MNRSNIARLTLNIQRWKPRGNVHWLRKVGLKGYSKELPSRFPAQNAGHAQKATPLDTSSRPKTKVASSIESRIPAVLYRFFLLAFVWHPSNNWGHIRMIVTVCMHGVYIVLGDQHGVALSWYPTQLYYRDTEPTSHWPFLIMPSAWLMKSNSFSSKSFDLPCNCDASNLHWSKHFCRVKFTVLRNLFLNGKLWPLPRCGHAAVSHAMTHSCSR